MIDLPFAKLPLTPAAEELKEDILSIPWTDEPMLDDLPDEMDPDELAYLHDLAVSSSARAIPEIRRMLKKFPTSPQLLNYLHAAYKAQNSRRQADDVIKQLTALHPNYLFGRLALCQKDLDNNRLEQAAARLGPTLDIRDLYPERDVFHVSELRNYYYYVTCLLARRGEPELAQAVVAALEEIYPDNPLLSILKKEIAMANIKCVMDRMAKDKENSIRVKSAPLSLPPASASMPNFHHDLIAELYDFDIMLTTETIREILALPRETLVKDLTAVLDDCAVRTQLFMKSSDRDEEHFAAFHAIQLLAEINGHEACDALLRFLSMPYDALKFSLPEGIAYPPEMSRIIAHGLPACLAWLRSPGICSYGKGLILEAMEELALREPALRSQITSDLGDILAFVIDSPVQHNILDTGFISGIICTLTALSSSEQLPIIHKAYEKNLVELFFVGTLTSVEEDIVKPLRSPFAKQNIFVTYENYSGTIYDDIEEEEEEVIDKPPAPLLPFPLRPQLQSVLSGLASKPIVKFAPTAAPASRNSPCPCGSGKKYKKCCAP
jgi:hypothetical protein